MGRTRHPFKDYTMHESYPPASKASREVANITELKNLRTPVYGVKEFVCWLDFGSLPLN